MNPWDRTRKPEELKVGWRWLTTKWFKDPNGIEQEYVVVGQQQSRSVATIALTKDFQVIVSEQFRPGPELVMQEIPGGDVEKDEELQAAALRELKEETGYVPSRIEHLGKVYKSAYIATSWDYFIAYECEKAADQQTDEGEFVEVRTISIEQLFANGRNSRMSDAEALFLGYEKLKKLGGI